MAVGAISRRMGREKSMGSIPTIAAISVAGILLLIVPMWKVFTKARQPGWGSIVPIYEIYLILRIIGKPGWWLLLLMVPFLDFVIVLIIHRELARSFGKGIEFTVGLLILPFIFWPILGYGKAKYLGAGSH